MAEPTLDIFGTGTTRLASSDPAPSDGLFIPDSALVAAGLSTPTTATAEGHLVAILKAAQSALTLAGYDADVDQSIYIEPGFGTFTTRGVNNDSYRVDQLSINIAKIDSGAVLDPDDY